MSRLMQIKTSLFSGDGQSSRLTDAFVAAWRAAHPDGELRVRDLGAAPLPHLSAERFQAFTTPAEARTPAQQAIVAESDALIEELRWADTVVLGLPMYNFGIPSTLQTWFDHVARAGVSFRYTAQGPQGLLGDRKVRVLATRGGLHAGTATDSQTGHVSAFFALLGMRDVEFTYAEGLGLGADRAREALDAAQQTIQLLAA